MQHVLILGGSGRIGRRIAADLVTHTQVPILIAGRNRQLGTQVAEQLGPKVRFLSLELGDQANLTAAIAAASLVIHCAGPFHYQDASVLQTCIQEGANYLDVSDHRSFTAKSLACQSAAQAAGITAVINAGIFPGISNSMVRQGVEQLDKAEQIHLSYLVAGSGGAGVTVMRTTFLGLQHPFDVWRENQWQVVQPYSEPELVEFPPPYGRRQVYWFDMPEAFTLPQALPVKTVTTKFGSVPELYSRLTWLAAHWFPTQWLQRPEAIEFLAQVSHWMTQVTDRWSGTGVAIRAQVNGEKDGRPARFCSTLVQADTAIAAGLGAGSIAELLLTGQLHKPGVWTVEEVLPTTLFTHSMATRKVKIVPSLTLSAVP
ncbi:MAG TPA: saccharopine dehydrogenase NADP-binding domain-containing protein [Candidatus Caenarcaniphilales bacterium]